MKYINLVFMALVMSILTFSIYSQSTAKKRQIIGIINEELAELDRLNRQTGVKNPGLLIRSAELLLEKARIIKEDENNNFLSLPIEKRRRVSKSNYFKQSTKIFKQAQRTCLFALKRFPNLKDKGLVYYILAYNSKEFRELDNAKRYFKKAIAHTSNGHHANSKAKVSLAEIYFNEKSYGKAIPLYESVIRKRDNRWWTKDAYNLAWAYYKEKKYDRAIRLMEKVFDVSSDSDFVDMRRYVKKDLVLFYVRADRINDAIEFYEDHGEGDLSESLVKIGKQLQSKGEFITAEDVFKKSLKVNRSQKQDIEIRVALLSLYEKFGRVNQHLATSKVMESYYKKNMLSPDHVDVLKYQVGRMGALLQKQVAGKTYRRRPKIRKEKARNSVQYFEILATIEQNKSKNHLFHAGETLLAAGLKNEALEYYEKSYILARDSNDKKISKLSLDGMMASLAGKGISEAAKKKYIGKVYTAYLRNNPKSKKSYKIYQRLFNEQMTKKDINRAEQTLADFKRVYPQDYKTQEAMLARLMDHYRKTGNRIAFQKWVGRINRGEYRVSPKYRKTLKGHLTNMQFENVQKASSKGDKLAVLKGYAKIYKDPSSTDEAKTNSAYNMTVLFFELGDTERTSKWSLLTLDRMKAKEADQYKDTFVAIASDFFLRRRFNDAAMIYDKLMEKICRVKTKSNKVKKTVYKNMIVMLLSDSKLNEAASFMNKYSSCSIPSSNIVGANLDLLKSYKEQKEWSRFEGQLSRLQNNPQYYSEILFPMFEYFKILRENGRYKKADRIKARMEQIYQDSKKRKKDIPLEGLDAIALFKLKELEPQVDDFNKITLSFPEQKYNQLLKAKFAKLDQVTNKAIAILKTGSGKGIVRAYKILVQAYDKFAKEIDDFTPPGKSPEYIKSFKTSMKSLSQPVRQKSREFFQSAKKEIIKSSILSFDNKFFTGNQTPSEYHLLNGGVVMDRGGK